VTQTKNPCAGAIAWIETPVSTSTYAYKKGASQTDTVKWSEQITNSQASNPECPVVYKLYDKDCDTKGGPPGFSIASSKDQVVIADIGTK